jgi:hypothetical protein
MCLLAVITLLDDMYLYEQFLLSRKKFSSILEFKKTARYRATKARQEEPQQLFPRNSTQNFARRNSWGTRRPAVFEHLKSKRGVLITHATGSTHYGNVKSYLRSLESKFPSILELTGGTANEVNFSCSNLTNPRNLRR